MASAKPSFLPNARPLLSQGDVYLAPSVMVWSAETLPALPLIPSAPAAVGDTVQVPAWNPGAEEDGVVPHVTLATSWVPVLVLSHDCEIDKEFNEHVDALIRAGSDEAEAIARAAPMWELDRRILVSPLLAYEDGGGAERRWEAVRAGRKIGYFPLPPMEGFGGAEFHAHLSRISTLERRLLTPRTKLASLNEDGRALLRFKLAEALASRNLSVLSRLETAIGRRIEDVRTLKVKRGEASVALVLDDGTELQVGASSDPDPPLAERTRPPG
jgi:hypothetical protein